MFTFVRFVISVYPYAYVGFLPCKITTYMYYIYNYHLSVNMMSAVCVNILQYYQFCSRICYICSEQKHNLLKKTLLFFWLTHIYDNKVWSTYIYCIFNHQLNNILRLLYVSGVCILLMQYSGTFSRPPLPTPGLFLPPSLSISAFRLWYMFWCGRHCWCDVACWSVFIQSLLLQCFFVSLLIQLQNDFLCPVIVRVEAKCLITYCVNPAIDWHCNAVLTLF